MIKTRLVLEDMNVTDNRLIWEKPDQYYYSSVLGPLGAFWRVTESIQKSNYSCPA